MPFPQQTARAFTRANIETITSGQMGVYGLFKQNQWVYLGRGDIRERLLAHMGGDNACISSQAPTHWVDEVTTDHVNRERQLIAELGPTSCNVRFHKG